MGFLLLLDCGVLEDLFFLLVVCFEVFCLIHFGFVGVVLF